MGEFFSTLLNIAVPVFAVSSMLSVGFRYEVREILAPLRDVPGVISALVANFILVPLLAVGIVRLLDLDRAMAIGLIVVASAAGAPFLLKLTENAGENVAFAASILVLLLVLTIGYMPLVVPLLAPGSEVGAAAVAMPLVVTMLLPLGLGFLFETLWPATATRLLPLVGMVTNVALVAMVAATVLANLGTLLGVFGTGAILGAVMLIAGAFGLGYLVGTFDPKEKVELGFATAQRNFAAATVVATQAFDDPGVLVMTVVASTAAMVLLLPVSLAFGRRKAAARAEAGADGVAGGKETHAAR